jgi:hypothetical protein
MVPIRTIHRQPFSHQKTGSPWSNFTSLHNFSAMKKHRTIHAANPIVPHVRTKNGQFIPKFIVTIFRTLKNENRTIMVSRRLSAKFFSKENPDF